MSIFDEIEDFVAYNAVPAFALLFVSITFTASTLKAVGCSGLDPEFKPGARTDFNDKITLVTEAEPKNDPETSADYTVYAQEITPRCDSATIKSYFFDVAVDDGIFMHDKKLDETVACKKTVHISEVSSILEL